MACPLLLVEGSILLTDPSPGRRSTDKNCGLPCDCRNVLSLSLAHLMYLLIVRPYRSFVELILVIAAAILQTFMSLIACLMVFSPPSSDPGTVFGWADIVQSGFFFVPIVVLGVEALTTKHHGT